MEESQSRRSFLINCAKAVGMCPLLLICSDRSMAFENLFISEKDSRKSFNFRKYSFCGIKCEEQCELYKATAENDVEAKKKIYLEWKWKEKFGIEFDAQKIFCYSCKPCDLPYKIGIKECKVRICATEKNIETCIQCARLDSCDLEFWKEFNDFYKFIIKLQKQYTEGGGKLI